MRRQENKKLSSSDWVKAIVALFAFAYFFFDWRSFVNHLAQDALQWPIMFVGLFWLCSAKASKKGSMSWRERADIAMGCASLLLVFAFLTNGYGCSRQPSHSESDCSPAGPSIYNTC